MKATAQDYRNIPDLYRDWITNVHRVRSEEHILEALVNYLLWQRWNPGDIAGAREAANRYLDTQRDLYDFNSCIRIILANLGKGSSMAASED